jgi:RNA polymerase sigma factor (sigma-70 family)
MDNSQATRPSLLVRIRDLRDSQAWAQFVEIYSPLVYRFARSRDLQDADASDVTQEVMRSVARSIGRFDYDPRKGSFRGWLMTVAHARVCDFLARDGQGAQGRGGTAMADLLKEQPATQDEEDRWEQEYRQCVFDWAAEQVRGEVEDATWQAFSQTAVEGKSAKQAAESLAMTEGAVYVAKCRVLARLKKKTGEIEP